MADAFIKSHSRTFDPAIGNFSGTTQKNSGGIKPMTTLKWLAVLAIASACAAIGLNVKTAVDEGITHTPKSFQESNH